MQNKFILLNTAGCRQFAEMRRAMPDSIESAWTVLRSRLETRSRELYDEVRIYPRPIARCDEQLTRAIEQRDAAFRCLRRAKDLDELRATLAREAWLTAVSDFVASLEPTGDEAITAARREMVAALGR
jgi:hypothetical protein